MAKHAPVTVVETEPFEAAARKIKLSEGEFFAIADHLSRNPEAGDVMEGTAGLRKVRFARPGMGKRGGYRTVHYYMDPTKPLFLFTIYDHRRKADLTAAEKKRFAALVRELREAFRTAKEPD